MVGDDNWWDTLSPDTVYNDLRLFWHELGLDWNQAALCALSQLATGDIFEDYGDFADYTKTKRACA